MHNIIQEDLTPILSMVDGGGGEVHYRVKKSMFLFILLPNLDPTVTWSTVNVQNVDTVTSAIGPMFIVHIPR